MTLAEQRAREESEQHRLHL
jgi:hypothetical protein